MSKYNEKQDVENLKKDLRNKNEEIKEKKKDNEVLEFFLGIILVGAGLYMLSRRVIVHSGWYSWRIGSFDLSSGTIIIPLIIGVIWYFYNSKSIAPKIIITLSIIFIVLSIIMSTRVSFIPTSMFDYILIFVLLAAGAGLLLKALFKVRRS